MSQESARMAVHEPPNRNSPVLQESPSNKDLSVQVNATIAGPVSTQSEQCTLTACASEPLSQWSEVRRIQFLLECLRQQAIHRDSIQRAKRPVPYSALREECRQLFEKDEAEIEFEKQHCRSALQALARWQQTLLWVDEALAAAEKCQALSMRPHIRRKVCIALRMAWQSSVGQMVQLLRDIAGGKGLRGEADGF